MMRVLALAVCCMHTEKKEEKVKGLGVRFRSGALSRMTRVLAHAVCCMHKGEKGFRG